MSCVEQTKEIHLQDISQPLIGSEMLTNCKSPMESFQNACLRVLKDKDSLSKEQINRIKDICSKMDDWLETVIEFRESVEEFQKMLEDFK